MTKPSRRYVGRAQSDGSWRVWNKLARKWWGDTYRNRPDALIDELNGEKRPDVLTELSRQLHLRKNKKTVTLRLKK